MVEVIRSTASTVKSVPETIVVVHPAKRTKIILEENENIGPTGQYFGHNGDGTFIRPGEPVDVKDSIIEILENAKISVTRIDPVTLRPSGTSDRLRFPYRIVTG